MKKNLLVLLLLIPFFGMSQTAKPIEGVLGIKFGSNKADVIAAVKAKGGTFDAATSNNERLFFDNVKLGQRTSNTFQVQLLNDKVYYAGFVFHPENDPEIFTYYQSLVNDISDIYGKGNSQSVFKSPYKNEDSESEKLTAIQTGYSSIYTNWVNDGKRITVYITSKLQVIISYMDDAVMAEIKAKQKEKEKSDY